MCIGDVASSAVGGCNSGDNGDTILGVEVMDGAAADCSSFQKVEAGAVTIGGAGVLVCCTPG